MADRLTEDRLNAIRARLAAASGGTWTFRQQDLKEWEEHFFDVISNEGDLSEWMVAFHIFEREDADFIAQAHDHDIPDLLAEVEALRGERDSWRRQAELNEAHGRELKNANVTLRKRNINLSAELSDALDALYQEHREDGQVG